MRALDSTCARSDCILVLKSSAKFLAKEISLPSVVLSLAASSILLSSLQSSIRSSSSSSMLDVRIFAGCARSVAFKLRSSELTRFSSGSLSLFEKFK